MTQDDKTDLSAEIERVTHRFWELSSQEFRSDGFQQIAVGLQSVFDDAFKLGIEESRLRTLIGGLDALTDALIASESPPAAKPAPTGLDQFVGAFRLEAQKRLAGLSISMMGIFNSGEAEASVRQSAEHLHAIRGGAGMLGMTDVASLSGAMEDFIHALARAESRESTSVKPLLRAFAVLKTAIEDPEERVDAIIEDVVEELRTLGGSVEKNRTREETAVHTRQLEQRILVLDDVETIAASIGFVLSELDVPVDVVTDPKEAFRMLHERPYSLVVSDVSMPGMDGIELVKAMRADEMLSDISIILLTQLDRPEERERGLAAGADDYIVKGSIGGGELIARVTELLLDAPYVPTIAKEVHTILVVEDTETIAASIAFVLSEGPYEIVLAHDGQDALYKLERRLFDLVISDIEMPSMNGIELLRIIRAREDMKAIPVVILTSRGSEEERLIAREAGANRFLLKGAVGGGELQRVVAELLVMP